jgi:uncharacterized protein (TIGR02118 family)
MFKVIVLYNIPEDKEAFNQYYKEKHLPLVEQIEGISKIEWTEIKRGPGGSPSDYHLMAELHFRNEAQMNESMSSPEGQATVDDLAHFASAGVTILIGNTVQHF